jgi:hypothetical protein
VIRIDILAEHCIVPIRRDSVRETIAVAEDRMRRLEVDRATVVVVKAMPQAEITRIYDYICDVAQDILVTRHIRSEALFELQEYEWREAPKLGREA